MHDEPRALTRSGAAELIGDERALALESLSPRERARFGTEPAPRREAFLAGRRLLRGLVGDVLGVEPAAVPLTATCPDCSRDPGRPTSAGTDLHVSLAHRADAVVAVVARGARVGIDLEQPSTRVDDLAPLIPNPSLQRWTRIEAVLKADGRGLRVDPAAVVFEPVPGGELASVPGSPIRYLVREVDVVPGVRASVAIEQR